MNKYKLSPEKTIYLLIDVQERLGGVMPEAELKEAIHNTVSILKIANLLNMPVVATRQYPKALGGFYPDILNELKSNARIFDKLDFSAYKVPEVADFIRKADIKNVVLNGMEAHICVLETAIDLLAAGINVHVVKDASLSRTAERKNDGLSLMRDAGAVVTNTETAMYQLIGGAKHPNFKDVSKILR